jgi:hypothetical protein
MAIHGRSAPVEPGQGLIPNYTDDLESFRYTLLYTTLRHCEHEYSSRRIVSVLNTLFDFRFQDDSGMVGGTHKQAEIMRMNIPSLPLLCVLQQSARILATRYLDAKSKAIVEEITRLKGEYEGDDFSTHLFFNLHRLDLYQNYTDWEKVQQLKTSGWMEEVFDTVLKDPESDWEQGGGKVERDLSPVNLNKRKEPPIDSTIDMPHSKQSCSANLQVVDEAMEGDD